MIYPLVRELAAESIPVRVPVAVTCRVLGLSKQAYYQWCAKPVSGRDLDDAYLTNAAVDAHRDDPAFGYRFIADELAANAHLASERRVWRLIVGYSIGDRMKASLAVAALRMAIRRGYPTGTVVHSDRGSQFRSTRYVRTLANNGLIGSMGRVGACADNAAMESFFSLLQNNVLDTRRWETRDDLRLAIVTWIERTYHRRRRQRALGKLTPIEFETLNNPAATTVAA